MLDIAVVIPTFNRRSLLPRALDSVLAQTLPAREIVVVDDGSTDGTAEFIRDQYPGITVIRQQRRGVSAARNRGIDSARSDWIALLDSDDAWAPQKLERQAGALATEPAYRFCHTDETWIRRGVRVNAGKRHAKPTGPVFEQCLPLCCISPSAALIHREVLTRCGNFDESLPACEDYDLWLRIAVFYPVLLVAENLVIKHGGHADQLSRKYWGMDRFRVQALDKLLGAGNLDVRQFSLAREMLVEKVDILVQGFEKRNNRDAARQYRALAERWQAAG